MSEWDQRKLGDISIKIGSGATPKGGSNSYQESGISLIRSQNVLDFQFTTSGLAFIDESQADALQNVEVAQNDVLLNITGDSVARCCLVPDFVLPARVNQHVSIIRPDPQVADFRFIFYQLQYLKDELLMQSEIGATRKALTKGMIEDLDITLPPLPEQKAIAAVLSALDDKIDLLHRQNRTLESLAQALFRHWFSDGAGADWDDTALEIFIDFLEGPGIRNWQYADEGVNFINIRLIQDGEIEVGKANKITTDEAYGKYSHFLLKERDIIVSSSGTLGRSAIVRSYHLPLCLNTSVIRFRPVDGFHYSFVYQYLQSEEFLSHLETMASGSAQLNFGPIHLKKITIAIPPKDTLDAFEVMADPLYQKLNANYHQIRTLAALRDSLLPKLMSGEVRVRG